MTKVKRIGVNPAPLEKKIQKYKYYYSLLQEEKEIYEEELKTKKDLTKLEANKLKKRIWDLEFELESKKIYIENLEEFAKRNN